MKQRPVWKTPWSRQFHILLAVGLAIVLAGRVLGVIFRAIGSVFDFIDDHKLQSIAVAVLVATFIVVIRKRR